jgi:hypothetical protein
MILIRSALIAVGPRHGPPFLLVTGLPDGAAWPYVLDLGSHSRPLFHPGRLAYRDTDYSPSTRCRRARSSPP